MKKLHLALLLCTNCAPRTGDRPCRISPGARSHWSSPPGASWRWRRISWKTCSAPAPVTGWWVRSVTAIIRQQAKELPEVGSYNAFSLEQILALQPDLVVMWGSGNGMQTLSKLEGLGIPVYVSELRKLSDVPESIRRLGQLAGTSSVAEAEARRIESELESLRNRYGGRRSLGVFYQIWNDPLQTVNGEHLISEVIALCGGRNVFGDASALAPRISVESVLLRNPDAIVASGMGEARPEWLDQWRAYPSLKAVAGDALFFINPDHLQRPTARILLGAQRLCQQLDQIR